MPPLPKEELEESYIKGSGPGGQKIVRNAIPSFSGKLTITSSPPDAPRVSPASLPGSTRDHTSSLTTPGL